MMYNPALMYACPAQGPSPASTPNQLTNHIRYVCYRELCCSAFAKKTAEDLAEQYGGETVSLPYFPQSPKKSLTFLGSIMILHFSAEL